MGQFFFACRRAYFCCKTKGAKMPGVCLLNDLPVPDGAIPKMRCAQSLQFCATFGRERTNLNAVTA